MNALTHIYIYSITNFRTEGHVLCIKGMAPLKEFAIQYYIDISLTVRYLNYIYLMILTASE